MADKNNRLDQIMKVDTASLLKTIKSIEDGITNFNKFESQPAWASEIIDRITKLESGGSAMNGHTIEQFASNSSLSINDLMNDERVMFKMKTELSSHVSSLKFSIETKVASLNGELERMHKLLEIRPTTSELQQVVSNINELDRRTRHLFSDLSSATKGIVQTKVVEEMGSVMKQLKMNEELNEQSLEIVFKKVDGYSQDISEIQSGISNFMDTVDGSMAQSKSNFEKILKSFNEFSSKSEKDQISMNQSFGELRKALKVSSDLFNEQFAEVSNRQNTTEASISRQRENVQELSMAIDKQLYEVNTIASMCKTTLEEFMAKYDLYKQETNAKLVQSFSEIDTLQDRTTDIENFVELVKSYDLPFKLKAHEDDLHKIFKVIESHTSSIKDLFNQEEKSSTAIFDLQRNLSQANAVITSHTDVLEKLVNKNIVTDQTLTSLETEKNKLSQDVFQLFGMCEEISILREAQSTTEQRVKAQQNIISTLLESTADHDQRIEQIIDVMDKSDEALSKRLDGMRGSMMDLLMKKQAEMDATIQNMRDNLDIISSNNDAFSINVSNKSSKGATMRSFSEAAVVLDNANVSTSTPSEVKPTASVREAQFIADLCINFEDISVRKTFVADIPPTMRENMVSTCQELAALIASLSDFEAVQAVLRDQPAHMDNPETLVSELRKGKIDDFIFEVKSIAEQNYPKPGIVRLDAREKFLRQLRKGLELFMSKHDQVLIMGSSSFGRVKIPVCIACDRPLLEKGRQDTMQRAEVTDFPARFEDPSTSSSYGNSNGDSHSNDMGIGRGGGGGGGRNNRTTIKKNSSPLKLPNALLDRNSSSDISNAAYVLRGGFKMPRPATSNIQEGNNTGISMSNSLPELRMDKKQ